VRIYAISGPGPDAGLFGVHIANPSNKAEDKDGYVQKDFGLPPGKMSV
jgi:hypothetical protein